MTFHSDQTCIRLVQHKSLKLTLLALSLLIFAGGVSSGTLANSRVLEARVGASLTTELPGPVPQVFEIVLGASQLAIISVQKRNLKTSVATFDPGGTKLSEIVSERFELMHVMVLAPAQGTYRIELNSADKNFPVIQVKLTVEQIRDVKPSFTKLANGWSAFCSARKLRQDWQKTSLQQALDGYAEANLSWKMAGDPALAATALIEAGELHFIMGEYREALTLYQKAAVEGERSGNRALQFSALGRSGLIHSYLGDNEYAQSLLSRVLDYYVHLGQPRSETAEWGYAEALHQTGEVFYARGDLTRALQKFNESLELYARLGDRRGEARSRRFIGYVDSTIGEHQAALAAFTHAQALAESIGDLAEQAFCITAIGTIHSRRSEWRVALELHRKAMQIFQTIGDTQSEAITLNGVGQAYDNQGDKQIALNSYKEALSRFQANDSLDFAVATIYQIARTYKSAGDVSNAMTYFQQCVKVSAAAKKRRLEAYAMNDIAALYPGQKLVQLAQYRKSLDLFAALGDGRGQALTLNNMGDVYRSSGDRQRALQLYERALEIAGKAEERKVELAALYSLARLEFDLGDLKNAQSYIEKSIGMIEDIRINVTSPDLRISYFAAVQDHYGLYIDLLMQLDRLSPNQGFAATALWMSESARARSLLEVLTEARAYVKQGVDPDLDNRRLELEREMKSKELYRNALIGDERHREEAEKVARELHEVTVKYRTLQEQIREANPRLNELVKPKPLHLEEIQAALDKDTVLLEYSLGEQRSYLWAVTRDSFDAYQLRSRKEIEDVAREVYALLTMRSPKEGKIDAEYAARVEKADREYPAKVLELSNMLLGPAVARLDRGRLLVVSEGMLQYIPFDVLPLPAKDPTTAANQPPLLTTHEVVVLPSFSILATTRREKPLSSSSAVVAVLADPVFSLTDSRFGNASAADPRQDGATEQRALTVLAGLSGGSEVSRLAHAAEEAAAIVSMAPPGTYLKAEGFDASRASFVDPQIGQYQILHFATHGLIDTDHPELSSLVLSLVDKQGKPADGLMILSDIYSLKLSSKVVVLSACETAIGKDVKGEGLISLTRGFMFAGAKSIIASLWKVDDRATAEMMRHFYAGMLEQGLPPGEALRKAKDKLRREPRWQQPYYWAGFVIEGEYGETIVVEKQRNLRATGLAVSIAFATLCGIYLFIKGRRQNIARRSS